MDINGISAASIVYHMSQMQQGFAVALLSDAMQMTELSGAQMIQSMESAMPPSSHLLDTYA
ncbi:MULTISPECIES: putative motility protein [Anaerotruncus]|jgi:hypothetical protein|uniref:Putative motility protein n=1 Tax=Anaerotruncus colihominis TaxID=169435 RepID=A0A845RIG9_9FIRM|nr:MULTISPECIES: putative motility protein [Anaerotruncus]MCI8492156.1 putative motility protein [Anaerotruncus sp.]MCR2024700.1 putative motility protein [Anaerotruncus colihominis]NBI79836.1 putative motility protein [Anaerotruncus colihominis]NDO38237.1 putative motility protein [Anaerotruncus colihominis]